MQDASEMDAAIDKMIEEKRSAQNPYLDSPKIEMVAKKG